MERSSAQTNRFDGATAVVTGGATSLGAETCRQFARRGASVIVADIDRERGAAVANELDETAGSAEYVETDVTSSADCDRLVERAVDLTGGVDILVNNAGIRDIIPVEDVTDTDWDNHIAVNLSGPFYCSRAAIHHLKSAERGRIINISSSTARSGHPTGASPYVASKGGVIGLTRALARELAADRVTVNAIAPHGIPGSGMQEELDDAYLEELERSVPSRRLPEKEDVASSIVYLASSDADHINGQTIDINGGSYMR